MSYEIERGKRVLSFPRGTDDRFPGYGTLNTTNLYVVSWASSNVTPQSFDWSLIAVADGSIWNSQQQMPSQIWEMAKAADGGSIKPNGRDCSGVTYLQAWKEAAKNPLPLFNANTLLWTPKIQAFTGFAVGRTSAARDEFDTKGIESLKTDYHRIEVYEAFKRLYPNPVDSTWENCFLDTPAKMLDALFVYQHRTILPFSIGITCPETNTYLYVPK